MDDDARFAEMISKIAHELRSPLTSVKGFSATLLSRWDRFDDTQRYGLIEAIHSDAERMSRIVSEVLDLARLESNQLELNKQSVQVDAILNKAVDNVSSLDGADRIDISVSDTVVALADPDRLQHILFNLVENAVKFSDEGPIEVVAMHSDGTVVIRVSDKGVGITPERLGDIFHGPGPTGQSATPRGTGLGLYLTKKLVEAHGGTIEVSSTVNEGSTFIVSLPAVTA